MSPRNVDKWLLCLDHRDSLPHSTDCLDTVFQKSNAKTAPNTVLVTLI